MPIYTFSSQGFMNQVLLSWKPPDRAIKNKISSYSFLVGILLEANLFIKLTIV
jgi:hypothetical protein